MITIGNIYQVGKEQHFIRIVEIRDYANTGYPLAKFEVTVDGKKEEDYGYRLLKTINTSIWNGTLTQVEEK